jgi:hypothetical protein
MGYGLIVYGIKISSFPVSLAVFLGYNSCRKKQEKPCLM